MIEDWFSTPFSVKRPTWGTDGDNNRFSSLATVASFDGHLQQASAELVQNLGLSFTKAYSVWGPIGADVREGDVIVGDGISYTVRAKQVNNTGDNKHIQLTVELDEIQGS